MIILSVGMPRAGSGWFYNLTHELILASGFQDAHVIRKQFHLQGILTEVNCNIGALTPRRLMAVLVPSLLGNTFVIKAHAFPSPMAQWLIRFGMMRAAYIFRDPRDAMLSAYENGQRALEHGHLNAFSHLVDFEAALKFMKEYVRISEAWLAMDNVLLTRYENLLQEYDTEAKLLLEFLRLDVSKEAVQETVNCYRPENSSPNQKGLHFSKGKIGRFRQKWTPEQQTLLTDTFRDYLESHSFPI